MRELRPGLWSWGDPANSVVDAAAAVSDQAAFVVVSSTGDPRPTLEADLFVTATGRSWLDSRSEHLGELASLDLWFQAEAAGALIVGATLPSHTSSHWLDFDSIQVAELVFRHLGYLPDRWARQLAVIDRQAASPDFLQAYNYSELASKAMAADDSADSAATRESMASFRTETVQHCHRAGSRDEIDLETHVPRKVGPQFWAFDRAWYRAQRSRWHELLEEERTDARPFVVAGNGPSLRSSLAELETHGDDVRLVTSNFAALEPALRERTHIHTVVNYLVAEQAAGLINLLPESVTVVVPFWLSYCIRPRDNVYFTETTADLRFSTDIAKEVSWVHTVSFYAMQLAYGLSEAELALVGFDHSYSQPDGIDEGATIVDAGPDTNHFRSDYFSGRAWQAADTDMMEQVYALAGAAFEAADRRIVNCSIGGALERFERQSLAEFVAREARSR